MNEWICVKTECNTEDLDTVCAVVSMIDAKLQIDDNSEIDRLDTIYGELIGEDMKNADRTKASVSIYLSSDTDVSGMGSFIKNRLDELKITYNMTFSGMDEKQWAEEWKKYYKPLKLCDGLTVVPTWEKYQPAVDEKVILMDPGMAFGSGTHETTQLCCKLLNKWMTKGSTVLDVGCGSGILAITAAKLGAKAVNAYDVDPYAVKTSEENVSMNGCENVFCGVSDLLASVEKPNDGYDFVTANIVADILERMAPDIGGFVKKGGYIVLSGILETQSQRVRSDYENQGFEMIDELEDKDWHAYVFRVNG